MAQTGLQVTAGAAAVQGAVMGSGVGVAGTVEIVTVTAPVAAATAGPSVVRQTSQELVTAATRAVQTARTRAANPTAGTKPTVEVPGTGAQRAQAMSNAANRVGRPDSAALKPQPQTTSQRISEGVRATVKAVTDAVKAIDDKLDF